MQQKRRRSARTTTGSGKTTRISVAELRRLRANARQDPIIDPIVRILDKISRIVETMAERLVLVNFGQTHLHRRLADLEHSALKNRSTTKRSTRRSNRA